MSTPLPPYERPSLQRIVAGTMNKMGAIAALRPEPSIDGVDVEELVAAYGSPLYVFSERTMVARVHELREALERRWPRVRLTWSYKTNYLDALCRVFHREGSDAEAVSGMEVDKALRNGVPMHRITYNGPHKSAESLARALAGGARVNLDHFDELAAAERVAAELGRAVPVGLRLNLAAASAPRWERFGFNLDTGQAWDAVRRMVAGGHLSLEGLHVHLGTFLHDHEAYREAAEKVARFANRLRAELSISVRTLDLGGGFASRARLKAQYLPADQVTPSLTRYAEAITEGLSALDSHPDELPTLVLETGRALIDDAGTMVTTVVASKRLSDGRRAVVVDAGVNVLFTSFWYRHDIVPTRSLTGAPEPTVIYGPLCMNIDVVRDHLLMPPPPVGSRLLVRPVGAYNVTQSMQFIELRPAVALIGAEGQHAVIRRAETLDDLVRGEAVPAWLQ